MPLDDALKARMAEPDFWPVYLFDDDAPDVYEEDADEQETFVTRFRLGEALALVLDLTPGLEYVELALEAPGLPEPTTVGWDDQAHFHPHVMPWRELDLLCRAVALGDPELRHPGPMAALLCRFAFLADNDDLDRVTPLVDGAFALTRPSAREARPRPETRAWSDLRNLAGTGLEWSVRPDGHDAVDQRGTDGLPLYSMRTPDSQEFPFAAWSALLTRARESVSALAQDPALARPGVRQALDRCTAPDGHGHLPALAGALATAGYTHPVVMRAVEKPVHPAEACWVVETMSGLPQGELVSRWFGRSPLSGSETWRLSLHVPVLGRAPRLGQEIAEALDAALRTSDLGHAEVGGSSMRMENGIYVHTSSSVDVLIRDDLTGGVGVISRVLHDHDAAQTATLHPAGKPDVIPLPT
ncbi:hypothetical protein OG539_02410 [Actinacidiphila glaucinigra]|uniref:hypothetical protein n=1 Tax=Actinacidiphila glaucinigra TaxID=235986 RepID=UPI00324EFDAA